MLAEQENNNNDNNDPNFERRVDEITAGLNPYIKTHLLKKVSRANATIFINYIKAYMSESNLNDNSKQAAIVTLNHLSEFHKKYQVI